MTHPHIKAFHRRLIRTGRRLRLGSRSFRARMRAAMFSVLVSVSSIGPTAYVVADKIGHLLGFCIGVH
jgi:hypothetical protein